MNKSYFYSGLASTLLIPLSCNVTEKPAPGEKSPNILLILADDMGFSDIGCYGGEVKTPNLDKLAINGLKYTQMHNAARSCPSRASLLTGLYPHQTGFGLMTVPQGLPGYTGDLAQNCVSIAGVLKGTGYSSYAVGKWHLTKSVGQWIEGADTSKINWPLQRGFDKFFGTVKGGGSYYNPLSLTYGNEPFTITNPGFYYTDAISDSAAAFLTSHFKSNEKKPFFCYVAYTAPHWPLHALDADIQKYKGVYDEGWDSIRKKRYDRMIDMGIINNACKLPEREEGIVPWEEADHKEWRARCMEVFAAQIDRMDQGIGRIIETLEDNGQLDNTLIIFLSDNGADASILPPGWRTIAVPDTTFYGVKVTSGNHKDIMPGPDSTFQSGGRGWANVSNAPFRYFKINTYQGGIATPFIVHWPRGIKSKGELRNQVAHIIDVVPTLMEVASAESIEYRGSEKVMDLEGKSLVPTFENNPIERDFLAWEHLSNRGILKDNWKLVSYQRDMMRYWEEGEMKFEARGPLPDWELYDVDIDRTETNDLADAYPEIIRDLSEKWEEWAVRVKVKPWPYGE